MYKFTLIFCAFLSISSYAKAEVDSCAVAATADTELLEKSGKIVSQELMHNYQTISLDYVASELTGEVSPVSGEDTYLLHRLYVIVNGVNYYPEEETLEEKAKDNLPYNVFVFSRPNPDEIISRNGKTRTFRIRLPDNPKQENGKYKYRIEYHADTFNGGICNYKFTQRHTLGVHLSNTSPESGD